MFKTFENYKKDFELEIVDKIFMEGWSEGLDYYNNCVWMSFPKKICKIDLKEKEIVSQFEASSNYGESVCWYKDCLYSVSYSNNNLYKGKILNMNLDFEKVSNVPEEHSWGICHNNENLILTGNNSNKLYFLNFDSFEVEKVLNCEEKSLEDLAFDGKYLWSSSFTTKKGKIFCIDIQTGKTIKTFSLPENMKKRKLDGLCFTEDYLLLAGKELKYVYIIEKPKI